jgi:hypothetical protein
MQENDLILSVYSFFKQKPSYESIELLEDATLISISYADLQHMYSLFSEFNFFGRMLAQKHLLVNSLKCQICSPNRSPKS